MTQRKKGEYYISSDFIGKCRGSILVPLKIVRFEEIDRPEVEKLLHKANTQPDLLEACELMVEYCEEQQIYDKLSKHGDFYYKAKAAIDKVKGGSK